MNQWIRKSIELAHRDGYLDSLHQVYSVTPVDPRDISTNLVEDIVRAYHGKDSFLLVQTLLRLNKFPIDDIYVGVLREYPEAINFNRKTVDRIGNRLFEMSLEDLLKACKQPKVDNRRMGELFHNWFLNLPYPKLDGDALSSLTEMRDLHGNLHKVLMLDGSRQSFRDFVNDELGCGLEKELDILLKVNGEYIIGEAKYFSGFGGHQNDQFKDAVDTFLLSTQGDATRIAVLDGVVWLNKETGMCRKIRHVESIAMSALLLPKFLEEIQQTAS